MRNTFETATSAALSPPPPPAVRFVPVFRLAPPLAPPAAENGLRVAEEPPPPDSSSACSKSFTLIGSVYFKSYSRNGWPSLVIGTSHAVVIRRRISTRISGSARIVREFIVGRTVTTSCSLVPGISPSPPPVAPARRVWAGWPGRCGWPC